MFMYNPNLQYFSHTEKNYTRSSTYYKDESEFLNFTLPHNLLQTLEVTTVVTTLLFVCGLFTNLIAIAVFSDPMFDRMSITTLMRILCLYNLVVLFFGVLQHHSFYLDFRSHVTPENRRYFCTYLLWFNQVFRHARTACIVLILYNRIKVQRSPDYFSKSIEAVRFPILSNALFVFLSTVYVSRYIDDLDMKTKYYHRTECTFSFIDPYRRMYTPDIMCSNIIVLEQSTIVCMLCILIVEVILRLRRDRYVPERTSVSSLNLSATCGVKTPETAEKRPSVSFSEHSKSESRTSEDTKAVSSFTELKSAKQNSVTSMAVVIVVLNIVTGGVREVSDTLWMEELFPNTWSAMSSFSAKAWLDISYCAFMATMYFFMCAVSKDYRESAYNLLYNVNVTSVHSDLSLGLTGSVTVDGTPRVNLVTCDPLVAPPGNRRNRGKMTPGGSEAASAISSVSSLDKAYFLNATRQLAIVEDF